ncbi:hypothetical protein M8818_001568 [Zalaria obscura]|uniref:Uncharacterized protein n=1 Tax=Zalaria obscura TaxID=2024903 RepID=A0ACC3SKU6_9PEZI
MGRYRPNGKDLRKADVEHAIRAVERYALNLHGYFRRHDLVPSVRPRDQVAAVGEGEGAAEGVGELCVRSEVLFYCCFLKGGRGLGEEVYDMADFVD